MQNNCPERIGIRSNRDGLFAWRNPSPQRLFAELRTTIEPDSAIRDETALM
jgi:hypothetical protein